MKKYKNPLLGKVELCKEGMLFSNSIKFGGEMKPQVNPREWCFLLLNALERTCKDENLLKRYKSSYFNALGSPVTQWRTKKSLLKKNYILLD